MITRSSRTALVGAALVCATASVPATMRAQEYRGSLFGVVKDATGAQVPDAKITIKNNATNVVLTVASTKSGTYSALNLDAGFYTVTVSAPNFSTLVRENIEVRTGERQGLDLDLALGSVGEQVVVTTEAPPLTTDTGAGGTVLGQEVISSIPLTASNVFSLVQLTAGASHASAFPDHLSERPFDNGGMDAYAMNGAPAGGNNNSYLIDGSPNNNNEGLGFVPPPDAVSQVNVITNGFDSELGRTGGAVTSVALKTGANRYHGDVYVNIRNNHADGQLVQNYDKARQVTQWSEIGFQVGGPIAIPHLFNGHDKAFFAVSYEHFFDKIPSSNGWSVPTASQAAGNFCSGAPDAQGVGTVIYDPTTNPRTAFGGCPAGQTGSVIPAGRIDPTLSKVVSLMVRPNVAGCSNARAAGCATNFTEAYRHADNYHAETARIDYNFNEKEKFFATYVNGNRLEYIGNGGLSIGASPLIYPVSHTLRINHGASANLTSILSPTMTATSRLNWLRHDGLGRINDRGSASQLGLSQSLIGLFGGLDSFPGIDFATTPTGVTGADTQTYTGITTQGGTNNTTLSDTWTASETLNKVFSKHSLKAGLSYGTILQNNQAISQIPSFVFSDVFTRANYTTSSATGDPVASALLGYPGQINYTSPFRASYKTTYVATFFQDDFRVNKVLTLNLGLRWDIQTPPHERYNRAVINFNPGAASISAGANGGAVTVNGTAYTPSNGGGGQYLGGLVYADPTNRSPYPSVYRDFAPRFGFAYHVFPKMVLRGGFGRFYDYVAAYYFPTSTGYQSISSAPQTSDNFQTPTLCANVSGCSVPGSNALAGLSANGYASAFPSGLVPATGGTLGARTGAGTSISFLDPNLKPTAVNQFNLNIQYQLPLRTVLEVAYSGSRSTNVQATSTNGQKSINQLTAAQYTALGASANTAVTNPFAGQLPGTTLNGATVARRQLLLPYPQFSDVLETRLSIGKLWYNSMQVKLEKRMDHGLTVLANFTWSRNLGATNWLNPNYDSLTQLTRQPVSIEQPFFTNIIVTYKPQFFDHSNLLVRSVLGGWTISGDAQFQQGTLIPTPTPGTALWTGVDPSKSINGTFTHHSRARWFNNCVADATGTTIIASSITAGCPTGTPVAAAPWRLPNVNGVSNSFVLNNIPTFFEGLRLNRPPYANASVFKSFQIKERLKFDIRLDAYNLTNTPWFGYGDNGAAINSTSPTSTSFGSVVNAQGNDPRGLQLTGRISF